MKDDAKILIVLTGSLGDIVRGFAVACAIKKQKPSSHITWVCDSTWKDIVKIHPDIDQVLVFDRIKLWPGLRNLFKSLRSNNFDITLDLQRHFKSGVCSWLSGSKTRLGFHPVNSKEFNFIFNNSYIEPQSDSVLKLFHYLAFLKKIGLEQPDRVDFGLSQSIFPEPNMDPGPATWTKPIGIVLSSSWETKNWPQKSYQELLHLILNSTDSTCLLLGSNSDSVSANLLKEVFSSERIVDLTGKTSLSELAGVIQKCILCLGPDSGPAHVAAALQVPYITLFGPTPPERVAPYGYEQLGIRTAISCSPCSQKRCPGLNTLCMQLISPKMVLDAVLERLN